MHSLLRLVTSRSRSWLPAVATFVALTATAAALASSEDARPQLDMYQQLASSAQAAEAQALGTEILRDFQDDPAVLNQLAWVIATEVVPEHRDLDLALDASERAVADAPSQALFAALDTLAIVQYLRGDTARALATVQQAIDTCHADKGLSCRVVEEREWAMRSGSLAR